MKYISHFLLISDQYKNREKSLLIKRDSKSKENLGSLSHRKPRDYQRMVLADAGTKRGILWLNRFGKCCN